MACSDCDFNQLLNCFGSVCSLVPQRNFEEFRGWTVAESNPSWISTNCASLYDVFCSYSHQQLHRCNRANSSSGKHATSGARNTKSICSSSGALLLLHHIDKLDRVFMGMQICNGNEPLYNSCILACL